MTDVKTPRRYSSPLRADRAAETRQRILDHARSRFAAEGLAVPTMADIARAADVSVQTVYAVFGSKAGLLLAILDELTANAGIDRLRSDLARAAAHPRRQLRRYVRFDRTLFEQGAGIIGVGLGSRAVDPEVDAWFAEGERRRRTNQRSLVDAWGRAGALRPGLTVDRAAHILWAMTGPAVYAVFVTEGGWRPAVFERWLGGLLEQQLFGG